MSKKIEKTPLVAINHTLAPEYLQGVIAVAIDYIKANMKRYKPLDVALSQIIRFKGGFRHPTKAPQFVLEEATAEAFRESNEVVAAVLVLWMKINKEVGDALKAYLQAKEIPISELDTKTNSYVLADEPGEFLKELYTLYQDFNSQVMNIELGDFCLMYLCLCGEFISEDSISEEEMESIFNDSKKEAYIWTDWLTDLQELPATAREWQKIDDFIDAVTEIAGHKQKELLGVEQLQAVLEDIKRTWGDQLQAYFGFAELMNWTAADFPLEETKTSLEKITELQQILSEHKDLENRRPDTRDERRSRARALEELASRAEEIYQQLIIVTESSDSAREMASSETVSFNSGASETNDKAESAAVSATEGEDTDEIDVVGQESDSDDTTGDSDMKEDVGEKPAVSVDTEPTEPTIPEVDQISGDDIEESSEGIEEFEDEEEPSEKPITTADSTLQEVTKDIEESTSPDQPEKEISSAQIQGDKFDEEKDLVETDEDNAEDNFIWQLLEQDDISGAYWYSKSLEAQGLGAPLDSWLLAALQGARWLEYDTHVVLNDLADIAYKHELKDLNLPTQMIALSTALYPALVAPESNVIGWINTVVNHELIRPYSGLNTLIIDVQDFAGWPVDPEIISGALTQEEREQAIVKVTEDVCQWIEEAPKRPTTFGRATSVWRYLASNKDSTLLEMLQPIVNDQRPQANSVKSLAKQWRSRSYVVDQIIEIDRKLVGRRLSPIEATAREQIIRRVAEACQLAEDWCRRLERERQLQSEGLWFVDKVQDFVHTLERRLPEAEDDLERFVDDTKSLSSAASAYQLQLTFNQIRRLFRIDEEPQKSHKAASLSLGSDLYQSLTYRLFWLPGCELDDDGQPEQQALTELSSRLRKNVEEKLSVIEIINQWFEKEDYRFIEILLEKIPEQSQRIELEQQHAERRSLSRQKLDHLITKVHNEIEQNVVDGVIYAEDRARLLSEVEDAATVLSTVENFGAWFQKLQNIQSWLENSRQERIAQQTQIWQENRERLEKFDLISEKDKADVIKAIEQVVQQQNLRVIDEYLAELRNGLDRGAKLNMTLYQDTTDEEDKLRGFVDELNSLSNLLEKPKVSLPQITRDIRAKKGLFWDLNLARLPESRYQEIINAVDAWRQLKSRRQAYRSEVQAKYIADLLVYLGFTLLRPATSAVILKQQFDNDVTYWQVEMTAVGLSPVPQFGSERQGLFHLVCIWERPGFDAIGAALRNMKVQNQPLLVFYFGRLIRRQREDLINFLRGDQSITMAILDELLLLFLAREYDVRLKAFFQCALPFTVANPYRPFAAGTVPQEVFFGRSDEISKLQQMYGPCIIYGGRQLGKSALLKQVYREFHSPEHDQYALFEDIKLLGDPVGQDIDAVWRRLRAGLIELGLLHRKASERPERLREDIKKIIQENKQLRILILLDEADNFLLADSKSNFLIVSQLKELMDITNRRFKVVFAGLHNVQRYQGITNQPLAHMGKPLNVGPLEPKAAVSLVEERLLPLGFRLQDRSIILRILSYTNYHPGLVQLFCHDLVDYLYKRPVRSLPPFEVGQDQIKEVYRDPNVRNEIRKRFEWTLDLDQRYKVIALTMIADQLAIRDSFSKAYNKQSLQELAQIGWPAAFEAVKDAEFQGYLEEMEGLGLLTQTSNYEYRLRSPNLVRLMGSEDEIYRQLQEISTQPPEIKFDVDSHRALLDPEKYVYSPLTFAQERLVNPPRSGIALIFGSKALGITYLREATKTFVPKDEIDYGAQWASIDTVSNNKTALAEWIESFISKHKGCEQLVLFREARGEAVELIEQVETALEICARHQKRRNQWLRVIFSFNLDATWNWLKLPKPKRDSIESRVDVAVVSLPRWNVTGIRQRLNQHRSELLSSEEVAHAVLQATGGWYELLDEFMTWCAAHSDPQQPASKFGEEVSTPGSSPRQLFMEGIEPLPSTARQVFNGVAYNSIAKDGEEIPIDLLTEPGIIPEKSLRSEDITTALEFLERMSLIERVGNSVIAETTARRALQPE